MRRDSPASPRSPPARRRSRRSLLPPSSLQGPLGGADSGAFVSQALRGAALVTDRLAAAAQSLAPDAPPRAVRTAVAGGLLLLAASFVKGVLSFFMTMGTVALGAYVATRVLGSDPEGGGGSARRRRDDRGARRGAAPERRRRERGGGADGVAGFLSGVLGGEEEDLMDVWFSDGGKKKGGKDGKRRR